MLPQSSPNLAGPLFILLAKYAFPPQYAFTPRSDYLAHTTAPLLHILSQFDQQSAAAAALPSTGGGAWAANGNGRGRSSIPGGERNLGGDATTAAAITAAATDRVVVVVVDEGGGSLQRCGNNVLPTPSPHPVGIG